MLPHVALLVGDTSISRLLGYILDDAGYAYTQCRDDTAVLHHLTASHFPCICLFSFNVQARRSRLLDGAGCLSSCHHFIALSTLRGPTATPSVMQQIPHLVILDMPFELVELEALLAVATAEITIERHPLVSTLSSFPDRMVPYHRYHQP